MALRQNVSFRTSSQTGVGISIEFQATYRHTGHSFLPFSGIHPRKGVLLSGGLPRQCAHWLAMTWNSTNSNLPQCRFTSKNFLYGNYITTFSKLQCLSGHIWGCLSGHIWGGRELSGKRCRFRRNMYLLSGALVIRCMWWRLGFCQRTTALFCRTRRIYRIS